MSDHAEAEIEHWRERYKAEYLRAESRLRLLKDAYRYVENGLMAAAHQTYHQSQQDLLDRYRKAIGK
jgi:hypothetical protein